MMLYNTFVYNNKAGMNTKTACVAEKSTTRKTECLKDLLPQHSPAKLQELNHHMN